MPEIAFSTSNTTRIVAHSTVVKYQCNLYYEAEGETVRTCENGRTNPSFQNNPLKCSSKQLNLNAVVALFYICFMFVIFTFAVLKQSISTFR